VQEHEEAEEEKECWTRRMVGGRGEVLGRVGDREGRGKRGGVRRWRKRKRERRRGGREKVAENDERRTLKEDGKTRRLRSRGGGCGEGERER